jgi:hypothetical protein
MILKRNTQLSQVKINKSKLTSYDQIKFYKNVDVKSRINFGGGWISSHWIGKDFQIIRLHCIPWGKIRHF